MPEIEPIYTISGGYANTYLVEGKDGFGVIDVGSRLAAEMVAEYITEKLKIKIDELRLITATHFHIDHIGGISHLLKIAPKAEVNYFFRVGKYLTGEEKLGIPPLASWLRGLIPAFSRLNQHLLSARQFLICPKAGIPLPFLRNINLFGYKPKCKLQENQEIPCLSGWRILATSGHSPDSVCFYHKKGRILISGDTVLNLTGTGELNGFYCSREEIRNSFRKLSRLPIDNIYPGHGMPIIGVKDAMTRVKAW